MSIDPANVAKLRERFEEKKFTYEGVEAWSARDQQGLLGYAKWKDFTFAIERAVESCRQTNRDPERHFLAINGKIELSEERVFMGAHKNLEGTKSWRPTPSRPRRLGLN